MSHKVSDFPSTTGVLRRLTCPKFVFGRGSAPDSTGGAHDAPPGCGNEAKIKWLYEGEMATLGPHQMGNEMKKVGNRWFSRFEWNLVCRQRSVSDACHVAWFKVNVTWCWKLEILPFSKSISSAIISGSWQMTADSLIRGQYLYLFRPDFWCLL